MVNVARVELRVVQERVQQRENFFFDAKFLQHGSNFVACQGKRVHVAAIVAHEVGAFVFFVDENFFLEFLD